MLTTVTEVVVQLVDIQVPRDSDSDHVGNNMVLLHSNLDVDKCEHGVVLEVGAEIEVDWGLKKLAVAVVQVTEGGR